MTALTVKLWTTSNIISTDLFIDFLYYPCITGYRPTQSPSSLSTSPSQEESTKGSAANMRRKSSYLEKYFVRVLSFPEPMNDMNFGERSRILIEMAHEKFHVM